jgi:hypothetical protein
MNKYNILAIFSNHTYNKIKYNISLNNITFILPHVNDIIIIDSENEEFAIKLKYDLIHDKIKDYIFIKNDIYLDFGKWIYVLNNISINNYDYILFINDSIIITYDMINFFNYLNYSQKKINIYGYNDSSQIKYHYQSYLFMINKDIIPKFKFFYESRKPYIYDMNSIIINLELNFYNIDEFHDCYIKIGIEHNINKNIYWENDKLYEKLLSNNILCVIKLKRIYEYQQSYSYEYFYKIPNNFNHSFYKTRYTDLKLMSNKELENHFLKFGQHEGRLYNTNSIKKILPEYYRICLKKINMNIFFDIDDYIDIYLLKKKYPYLKNEKNRNIILNIIETKLIINNVIPFYINIMKNLCYIDKNYDSNYIINNFNYYDIILDNKNLNNLSIIGVLKFYINNISEIKKNNKDLNNNIKLITENIEEQSISTENININNIVIEESNIQESNIQDIENTNNIVIEESNIQDIENTNNIVIEESNIQDIEKLNIEESNIQESNIQESNNKDIENTNNIVIEESNIKNTKVFDYAKIDNIKYIINDEIINDNIINDSIINKNKNNNNYVFDINTYIHIFDNMLDNNINEYFIDIIQNNKKINLPSDFDPLIYKNLNKDLNNLSNNKLIEHFINNGIKEYRLYRLPNDFNINTYKLLYNDLSLINNDNDILNHFINYGFKEGRLYKIPNNFNIDLYKKKYFKNINIDYQSLMHIFINSKK